MHRFTASIVTPCTMVVTGTCASFILRICYSGKLVSQFIPAKGCKPEDTNSLLNLKAMSINIQCVSDPR